MAAFGTHQGRPLGLAPFLCSFREPLLAKFEKQHVTSKYFTKEPTYTHGQARAFRSVKHEDLTSECPSLLLEQGPGSSLLIS